MALVGLAGAGMAALTLMACYGMPPCDTPAPDGGSDPYYCYDDPPAHCASAVPQDGGADGGVTDGGGNGPCDDVYPPPRDAGVPWGSDAGAPSDAGVPSDAGAPSDAGVPSDAGH
jgi:hypothetical protein